MFFGVRCNEKFIAGPAFDALPLRRINELGLGSLAAQRT